MTRNKFLLLLSAVLFLIISFVYVNYRSVVIPSGDKVAVTIFPLYDIVKNIAGDEVKVVNILPPGASPHTFDPTPQEVKKIVGSRAIFSIGHGLDNWSQILAKSVDINNIITVDKNIELIDSTHEHGEVEDEHEHESESDGKDPHYWLSVPNAIGIASQIKDELSNLFPEKTSQFEENFNDYEIRLQNLDTDIYSKFKKLPNNKISTFHNAWAYFGRDHGLVITTTFEEFPGEEPTVEYLKEFQKKIKDNNVKVIFSEPQFSTKSLEPIVKDLDITISTLDPIGGVPGRESFEALMNYNAEKIINALQ
jgi:zinc transport system substrate-binding protein